MSLKECPKCGADSIFLPLIPAAGYDGKLYGSRSEGFCNSPFCDQRLWYHPRTGRVTRRTVGITLEEYTQQKLTSATNLTVINIMRRHAGLSLFMEVDEPERVARALKSHQKMIRGSGLFDSVKDWFQRNVQTPIVAWFWYGAAAFKSPFQKD